MKTTNALAFGLAVAALVMLVTTTASAGDGLIGSSASLSTAERTKLAAQIDAYHQDHPEAFEAVRNVRGHRPEVYRTFRNPKPMVASELRQLGRAALVPMLEALAFAAPERRGATSEEWQALQVGMLQAVGVLRDPRAKPVLRLAFERASAEPVARAAAEALGRLCDTALLSKVARTSGSKRLAAIRGLGWCRQLDTAEELGALLDGSTSEMLGAVVAEALGTVGSSWAWRALGKDREAEGLAVREAAATALVPAFIRYKGKARAAARIALTMVEHPQLRELVARYRHLVDEPSARQLDPIVERIDKRLGR